MTPTHKQQPSTRVTTAQRASTHPPTWGLAIHPRKEGESVLILAVPVPYLCAFKAARGTFRLPYSSLHVDV